jgi:hypothetical protein
MMGIVTKTDFRHNTVIMCKQMAAKGQRDEDGKTGVPAGAGGKMKLRAFATVPCQ